MLARATGDRLGSTNLEGHGLGLQMGQRSSVAASVDTWRIEMKCAFPGPRQLRVVVVSLNMSIYSFILVSRMTQWRSGVGGFDGSRGSGRVRHQRLPRPPPPPLYEK